MSGLASMRFAEALHVARTRNASDVHLVAGRPPVMRVDGALETQAAPALSKDDVENMSSRLLDDRSRSRLLHEGDTTSAFCDESFGTVRLHVSRTSEGPAMALRLLPSAVPLLENLRVPLIVATLAQRSSGLVLFAGPTGSGKSTVLASLIDLMNRTQSRHIVTIEDPIEFRHASNRCLISQREVGRDVSTFARAIYGALRSDPDVILIGELRHPETMQAALMAAETGHLVYATLHTADAAQTIDRVISAFPAANQQSVRVQFAQTFVASVCMRLLPRAGGRGRIVAAEILLGNDAVRNIIREGKTHQIRTVLATCRQSGMQTLEAHMTELLDRQEITLEAACAATERISELRDQ